MNEAVMRSARNGDHQAFAKLVEEYYRPIYGLAFSAVGNWQAAEDVAQDAFLVAWVNIGKLRSLDAFGAWLRRIARNLAWNWIRSEHYRRALLDRRKTLAPETGPGPCAAIDNLDRADTRAETWPALETLSPPLREAVVLFYLEENSIAETAAMLGVTENSVKKRLQHARPKLRTYFEKQWKAEMERERQRVKSSEAGKRFMAGAALGPVSGLGGKLGTGIGLWLHSALHGEGAGRLASLTSLQSVSVPSVAVALVIVAALGAGIIWNANRQEAATDQGWTLQGNREQALAAAPAGAISSPVRIEEKDASDTSQLGNSDPALAAPEDGEAVPFVTVAGHVIDEQQRPIEGATVTVVAAKLDKPISEPAMSFGGGGGVGLAGTFGGGMSGGASGVGSVGTFGGGVSGGAGGVGSAGAFGGGISGGNVGAFGGGGAMGGSSGGVVTGGGHASTFALTDLRKKAVNEALLDETRRFSGESTSDGSFSIPDVPGDGTLIVSACAPGYCNEGAIYPATDVFPDGLTLTLSPGISIDGRLLSTRGLPVVDGLVQVTALTWVEGGFGGSWSKHLQEWAWTTTDDQGLFTLTVDTPGNAVVVARSMSQGEAAFSDIRLEPGVLAELRFPAYGVVCGKITEHNGVPASGNPIRLTGYATIIGEFDDGYSTATWGETSGATYGAITDAEGVYRIEDVDPQLCYSARIYDADETPLATDIELGAPAAGNTLVWNYTIPRPIMVKGVVKERASGRLAGGVAILCKRATNAPADHIPFAPVQAVTGDDGAFEMRLTTGVDTYAFGVRAVTEFISLGQRALHEGESAVVNLVVPGSWSRRFLVLDESGNPLAGVSVCFEADGTTTYGLPTQTGADGRVSVTDFVTGEPVKCRFQYKGNAAESDTAVGQDGMDLPEETIVIDTSA